MQNDPLLNLTSDIGDLRQGTLVGQPPATNAGHRPVTMVTALMPTRPKSPESDSGSLP